MLNFNQPSGTVYLRTHLFQKVDSMQSSSQSEKEPAKTKDAVNDKREKNFEALKPIWNEVHFFLEDAEAKLHAFKNFMKEKSSSLEATAHLSAAEFQEFLHESEVWFTNLAQRAEKAGEQAETNIDLARVRIHLAKMTSKDRAQELMDHLNRFTREVDALVSKTERETAEKLKRLGAKCREFKDALS